MFGIYNYWGFIAAAILLNLTPGTDSMYIITRSVSQGQIAGFYSVLGIISGILIHTLLAAFGLSVLLDSSPVAFMLVKYIGASYLCYLGIKMLMSKGTTITPEDGNGAGNKKHSGLPALDYKQIYKQGVLTNTFNPKVALFFLAFFPQFIDPDYTYSMLSFIVLGLTLAVTGFTWLLCLTLLASKFSENLRKTRLSKPF